MRWYGIIPYLKHLSLTVFCVSYGKQNTWKNYEYEIFQSVLGNPSVDKKARFVGRSLGTT